MHACKALDRQKISLRISPEGVADDSGDRGMMYEDAWQRREVCGRLHTVSNFNRQLMTCTYRRMYALNTTFASTTTSKMNYIGNNYPSRRIPESTDVYVMLEG